MPNKTVFYLAITALGCIGLWGLWLIDDTSKPVLTHNRSLVQSNAVRTSPSRPETEIKPSPATNTQPSAEFLHISELINQGRSRAAAIQINDHYSLFSSEDLRLLKRLFLNKYSNEKRLKSAQSMLKHASQALNDIDIWSALADVSVNLKDWSSALDAQLHVSELAYQPGHLELVLNQLVESASHIRASMEARGNEIGIRELYQQLYDAHSSHPRFQLELAQAHLRLDNVEAAKRLLEQLQYDPELGQLAAQKLSNLDTASATPTLKPKPEREPASDIVVPLTRIGNSFVVDTSINGRSTPLLLDTGASITSLSSSLIARLNLEPAGRSIRLSTANGITQAQLYRAKKLRLGRLYLDDLVVAEIDLGRNARFQGLLGTDLLNRINNEYSYLIDNRQNALIFRRR